MYDECDGESKKMILSRLIQSVKVKREYEVEIEFSIDFHQLGVTFDSPEWGGVAHSMERSQIGRMEPIK